MPFNFCCGSKSSSSNIVQRMKPGQAAPAAAPQTIRKPVAANSSVSPVEDIIPGTIAQTPKAGAQGIRVKPAAPDQAPTPLELPAAMNAHNPPKGLIKNASSSPVRQRLKERQMSAHPAKLPSSQEIQHRLFKHVSCLETIDERKHQSFSPKNNSPSLHKYYKKTPTKNRAKKTTYAQFSFNQVAGQGETPSQLHNKSPVTVVYTPTPPGNPAR